MFFASNTSFLVFPKYMIVFALVGEMSKKIVLLDFFSDKIAIAEAYMKSLIA